MIRRWLLLILVLLVAAPGTIRAQGESEISEVVLTDGSILRGRIVWSDGRRLAILTESLGRIQLDLADIRSIDGEPPETFAPVRDNERAGFRRDPDLNTILLSPTTETVGAGDFYFRNFELFFLNVGGGLTDDLDFSVGFLFPVSADVGMIAAGLKYCIVSRTEFPVGLAATLGGTILDEIKFGSGAIVAGIGNHHNSLNVSVHQGFAQDEDPVGFYMIGGDLQAGPGLKVLAEYSTGLASIFGNDDDIDGFLNIGLRFFGDNSSFSLTGIRPLGVDSGSFIAFPLAMYSLHF